MRRPVVRTLEQAQAATVLAQGQVEAAQAQALAVVEVERVRAEARRQGEAAERAARVRAQVEERERKESAASARRERRAAARARRRAAMAEHRAILAVVPIMATSAGVALPAQYSEYLGVTGSVWSACAIAAMVEGGTWAGAAMEASAQARRQPVGVYRALTWGCAAVAAAMNVAHGVQADSPLLATAYGMSSLLGPTVWAVYSRMRGHVVSGRSGDELRLAAARRLLYPALSWQALRLRAAHGVAVSADEAWAAVWTRRRPTDLPVLPGLEPAPAPAAIEGRTDAVEEVPALVETVPAIEALAPAAQVTAADRPEAVRRSARKNAGGQDLDRLIAQARRLRDRGMAIEDIAAKVERAPRTVRRWLEDNLTAAEPQAEQAVAIPGQLTIDTATQAVADGHDGGHGHGHDMATTAAMDGHGHGHLVATDTAMAMVADGHPVATTAVTDTVAGGHEDGHESAAETVVDRELAAVA